MDRQLPGSNLASSPASSGMRDLAEELWRRRQLVMLFTVSCLAVTLLGSLLAVPRYRAQARVLIEKENPNILSFQQVLDLDTTHDDYYQTQYRILKSRTLAAAVFQKLDLGRDPRYVGNDDPIKTFLEEVIEITPIRQSRLVEVGAKSTDPYRAADIANTLSEAYIRQNLEVQTGTSKEAAAWLSDQLDDMKQRVEASEQALYAYQVQSGIVNLDEMEKMSTQKLGEVNTMLLKARADRIKLEQRYRRLEELKRTGGPGRYQNLAEILRDPLIQQMKIRYVDLLTQEGELRQKFRDEHPRLQEVHAQMATLAGRLDQEIDNLAQSIATAYEEAKAREQSLEESLEGLKTETLALNAKAIQYKVLEREVETNRQLYADMLKRMKEARLGEHLKANNIRIIDRAVVPTRPYQPRVLFNLLLALIVGLAGGVSLALFTARLDDTVKTPEDIQRLLQVHCLGVVPHLEDKASTEKIELVASLHPQSALAEAYRGVRTSVLFVRSGSSPRSILITSAEPGEGKTLSAVNLALSMAQAGERVVLVDADLRKPRLHKIFELPNENGLSRLIVEGIPIESAVVRPENYQLDVIPSGPIPATPAELLGSEAMARIIQELGRRWDRVVIDSAPLFNLTDSVVLSRLVDATMLVVWVGRTRPANLLRATEPIRQVGNNLIGCLLNHVESATQSYYHYGHYGYGYRYRDRYAEDEGEKQKPARDWRFWRKAA
jgi:polysaccharide biosynthesis transport protein